ncbi:MAG TPA: hypothetical protein VIX18_06890, partial [Nitrospirota bacterium]
MYEQLTDILFQILSQTLSIFANKLIPLVGVGESAEAMEFVPPQLVVNGLVVLAALGILFGIALAIVAAKFIVK